MRVYPYYITPEEYPDYGSESSCAIGREIMGERVRFTGMKFLSADPKTGRLLSLRRDIRLFTEELELCDCLTLHWSTLFAPNFKELVDYVKSRDLLLGSFWGFVPGFEASQDNLLTWGEFVIPAAADAYLRDQLGERFFGYESGENDGRYVGSYAQRSATASLSHRESFYSLMEYTERIGNALNNRLLQFSTLNAVHYQAKHNNLTLLGAETGLTTLNSCMWHGFIRGASKQYGLLTFGEVSVWNRRGYKTYADEGTHKDGPSWGPTKGTSLSLMRRLLYQQYFYNCSMLGIQQNWLMGDDGEQWAAGQVTKLPEEAEKCALSPIGCLQQSARRFMTEQGSLGVFHTPVAVLLDFYAGWIPPRHMYSSSLYRTWGCLPYREGDYQTHALFSMLYPGYENAGWYGDESGFLTATPYGDMTDVLLSDAAPAVLKRYPVLLITNDVEWDYEFYRTLSDYVEQGGHVVLCAGALAKPYARLSHMDEDFLRRFGLASLGEAVAAEEAPVLYGDKSYPHDELVRYTADLLGSTQVVASVGGAPFICRTAWGAGTVSLILSDTALQPCDREVSVFNAADNDIVTPYLLTPAVQAYIGDLYRAHTPIYPTNPALQFGVAVQDERHVTLQVSNNTHCAQKFDLRSFLSIESVEELPIEDGIAACEGYYPEGIPMNNDITCGEGAYRLDAGDVSFYRVTLDASLCVQKKSNPTRPKQRVYLRLPAGQESLRRFVLDHPTLPHRFAGVQVDASYLLRTDTRYLEQEAAFLKRQGIRILVDFLPLLNHYPHLSLLRSFPQRYEESMATALDVVRKAELFDCAGILLSVMRNSEMRAGDEELQQDMLESFETLAGQTRLPLYLVNRPVKFQIDEAYGLAEEIGTMRLMLDTCAAQCVYASPAKVNRQHEIQALSVSMFDVDRYEQRYNAHRPVYGAPGGEELRRFVRSARVTDFTVLAADYKDWDEVIRDYVYLFEE